MVHTGRDSNKPTIVVCVARVAAVEWWPYLGVIYEIQGFEPVEQRVQRLSSFQEIA